MKIDRRRLRLQRARKWVQAAEQGLVSPAAAREALAEIERQLNDGQKVALLSGHSPKTPVAA